MDLSGVGTVRMRSTCVAHAQICHHGKPVNRVSESLGNFSNRPVHSFFSLFFPYRKMWPREMVPSKVLACCRNVGEVGAMM